MKKELELVKMVLELMRKLLGNGKKKEMSLGKEKKKKKKKII
jgi:hypothetical protein